MKKYSILFFALLLIGLFNKAQSQEEFYGNKDGFSIAYLQGLSEDVSAIALSGYIKEGYILGFGLDFIDNESYPTFTVLMCPNWDSENDFLKVGFGPSYSKIKDNFILGFNTTLAMLLFKKSQFPMSISVSTSQHLTFIKNQWPNSKEKYSLDLFNSYGIGITQAFFAKKNVYPVINIHSTYDSLSKRNIYSAAIGINIKTSYK